MSQPKNGEVPRRFVDEPIMSNALKKEGRLRYEVWDHFTPFQDVDGTRKGKCNYCGKTYCADSKKNGTSSLRAHISSCKRLPSSWNARQSQLSSSPPIGGGEEEDEGEDEEERFLSKRMKKRQVRIDSYFKKLS